MEIEKYLVIAHRKKSKDTVTNTELMLPQPCD